MVHAIFSLAVIIGLVFVIGLACEGRWVAAFLWSIALLIGVAILRCLIGYVVAIAASGYLTDYHWWFARPRGWLPSPALIAFYLLAVAVAIIKENFSRPRPDDQKRGIASHPINDLRGSGNIPLLRPSGRQWVKSSRTPIPRVCGRTGQACRRTGGRGSRPESQRVASPECGQDGHRPAKRNGRHGRWSLSKRLLGPAAQQISRRGDAR